MSVPAVAVAGPVLVTLRSAEVATVVVAVAELFPVVGSVVSELRVAVLDRSAVRKEATWATRTRVSGPEDAGTVPMLHTPVTALERTTARVTATHLTPDDTR